MVTRKLLLSLAAVLMSSLTCMAVFARGGQDDGVHPSGGAELTDQIIREQGLTSVDSSTQGRRSMFIWDDYFFTIDAFPVLSELLASYQIDRAYQSIPAAFF